MADNAKDNTKIMQEKFADKTLDAEQLEEVTGGTKVQLRADAKVLQSFGIVVKDATTKDVTAAFAKIGVKCQASTKNRNVYYNAKTGTKITQQAAWQMAVDYAKAHGFLR